MPVPTFTLNIRKMEFTECLPFILSEEGGYSNNPNDPGGATNKGITQNTYNLYLKRRGGGPRDVRLITPLEVINIYRINYWKDGHCEELPPAIRLMHFDFAVNAGITQAAKTLQRCVGSERDGLIGPKTIAAAFSHDAEELIIRYANARIEFYRGLAERREKSKPFLKGWLRRVARCEARSRNSYRGIESNIRPREISLDSGSQGTGSEDNANSSTKLDGTIST